MDLIVMRTKVLILEFVCIDFEHHASITNNQVLPDLNSLHLRPDLKD